MFTPNSHYNEQSIWSSIARNQTLITSASSLVKGMGWYLLCTAFFLPISRLHPHLPLFPLQACLCCTLPLPSTAPPSWSHLETEQVLWRDRERLRKASPPRLMTPASFWAHYTETVSLQQPSWSQTRTGNITEVEADCRWSPADENEIVTSVCDMRSSPHICLLVESMELHMI